MTKPQECFMIWLLGLYGVFMIGVLPAGDVMGWWKPSHGAEADPLCFSSNVRELCCPSACAVRAKRMPSDADRTLRACWMSLGCKGSAPSSVGMFCDCGAR
jgi:hypothetical protein